MCAHKPSRLCPVPQRRAVNERGLHTIRKISGMRKPRTCARACTSTRQFELFACYKHGMEVHLCTRPSRASEVTGRRQGGGVV
eukprot:1864062-Prymnesium_polylepis.1